jgi:hypothetical protein
MLEAFRKILGCKRDDIIGGRRKLNSEEMHNFLNVIRMIKSGQVGQNVQNTRQITPKATTKCRAIPVTGRGGL